MLDKAKKSKKVYKSLYEVKNKYLPNADLGFLEGKDNDFTREAFKQMLKKIARPVSKHPVARKKRT